MARVGTEMASKWSSRGRLVWPRDDKRLGLDALRRWNLLRARTVSKLFTSGKEALHDSKGDWRKSLHLLFRNYFQASIYFRGRFV
jgi:hypothetical protein